MTVKVGRKHRENSGEGEGKEEARRQVNNENEGKRSNCTYHVVEVIGTSEGT